MDIKLTDVVKYYEGLEHQDDALNYLQESTGPEVLEEFANKWRSSEAKSSSSPIGAIMNRLAELGIELDKGLNIVGLEGCNPDYTLNNDAFFGDDYNDLVLLIKYNGNTAKIIGKYVATTEPGIYYTSNRLHKDGAARVQIDAKHEGVWQIGTHKNQHPALVQTGNKITICRDGNADGRRTGDAITSGYYGINCHYGEGKKIGYWSAGCCVIQGKNIFMADFMPHVLKHKNQGKFSYILLDASKIFVDI